MKRLVNILIAAAVLMSAAMSAYASDRDRKETIRMGVMLKENGTSAHPGRNLDQRLFVPKGAMSAGVQFSYFDLSSSDTEFMMLVRDLNASGVFFSIAPYFTYCLKDNRSLGLRLRWSSAQAGVTEADLSLLSDDLKVSVEDISGSTGSFMGEVFYRSYFGLDGNGRFGLFIDSALQYSWSNLSFSYNNEDLDAHTISNRIRIAARPGLEVFVMNNVSTLVSVGIGGISYTHSDYIRDGVTVGTRNVSRARFMPDLTDITMGLTIHF